MSDNPEQRPSSPPHLWKDQPMQTQSFTPEMLAKNASGLDRHVRRRNRFEYLAAGAVIAFCLVMAALLVAGGIETLADAISLAGILTLAAGSGIVIWQMHDRTGTPRAGTGSHATFASLRAELVRQRDALQRVWLWYLLPFAPGILLIYGADFARPDGNTALSLSLLLATLGVVLFICWLNLVAARRMQAEIDKLDRDLAPRQASERAE